MRRRIIVAMVLVGVGLALLWFSHSGGPRATEGNAGEVSAARPRGPVSQPEEPGQVGARGHANASGTPSLAQAPTGVDGILEVEVLAGERPWPGANVRLYWHAEGAPLRGDNAWRLAGSGTTDERGRVRLAARPGAYLVAVRARGHAPLLRDVVRPHGEARTTLRLMLEKGHSLSGHTVVHGTNEPLPLVELVFTAHGRQQEPWPRAEAPAEERVYVTSDERGNFQVDGLAPGGYLLEARTPGHARAVLSHVEVPAEGPLTVSLRGAGVIEGFVVDARGRPAADAEVMVRGDPAQVVTTGAEGGFSVEVEPGAHTLSARRGEEAGSLDSPVVVNAGRTVRDVRIRLGQGGVLEGRVVERASGGPVVGARVEVGPQGGSGDSGRALTDGEGHFSVGGLAPGSYDVRVSASGFSPTLRRGLTVTSGERFPVSLVLEGTGSVEGFVRDGAGRPVPGARVMGVNRWDGGADTSPVESRTDARGHYRLQGLAVGRMYLTARREGSTLGVRQPVEVMEIGTARVDFTLEGTGTVEGVVRAIRGPLPSEPLDVTALAQGGLGSGAPDIGRVEVGTNGSFRMELPPGTYGLLLTARRGLGSGGQQQVQVEEGRTVRVELTWEEKHGANEIRGIVLEPDGTPSPGAFVTLASGDGRGVPWMMAPADDEGRFAIGAPRVADAATRGLNVSARNGGRASEVRRVKPGEQEVVVKLRPAASIRGRVVGTGEPVRGFTLGLQVQEGFLPQGHGPWEFPGDRFELREVPAEPLKLVVRTADGSSGEALVSPGTGSTAEVEIPLRATAVVQGRVVDATTKAPLAGVLVFIEGEVPLKPDDGTSADGRFFVGGVRAGERILVIIGGQSRVRASRPVKLKEGEVLDVGDIPLGAGSVPP
ncbi:carboxypeptidase regulatory-like domain-containing protein [Archangium violaceum]|uniref:carboxypeptidase regulatory-like domain-containing protein n=1 Tax=Archangium violaceum TaxID=83451 RepID=UPI00193C19DD|nr:carboxypeptidase regulatory-like domain-containing protein [Archangium violaceum]QRK07407.1 carboxypeptidase regulatory-like domain-containing protein [Archangium violaceum]